MGCETWSGVAHRIGRGSRWASHRLAAFDPPDGPLLHLRDSRTSLRAGRSIAAGARAGRSRTCCGAGRAGSRPPGPRPAARRQRAARPRSATPTDPRAAGTRPAPPARPVRRPPGQRGSAAAAAPRSAPGRCAMSTRHPHPIAQFARRSRHLGREHQVTTHHDPRRSGLRSAGHCHCWMSS